VKLGLGFEEALKEQLLSVFSELKEESDGIYIFCGVLEQELKIGAGSIKYEPPLWIIELFYWAVLLCGRDTVPISGPYSIVEPSGFTR
jgi:hypothetical protein